LARTLKNKSSAELIEKGSRFIAYVIPVDSSGTAMNEIKMLWDQHPKASHICYAYRCGTKHPETKFEDDGEPSGTAGRPILNHIEGQELYNILIAVVRYFGGTLLGKGGLVSAYSKSAGMALQELKFFEIIEKRKFSFTCSYGQFDRLNALLNDLNLSPLNKKFTDTCTFDLMIPESKIESVLDTLQEGYNISPLASDDDL
jgi:uncharacterized YigZ family protein